jgi:hypothetical protein
MDGVVEVGMEPRGWEDGPWVVTTDGVENGSQSFENVGLALEPDWRRRP